MKDFFISCLKDLEPLTGIRQLYFIESDLDDGKRKLTVLIEGMLYTSKKFDYIPEEAQKSIIRKMMVEDQNYDALNSRVIDKWLNMHKDKWSLSEAKETPLVELTPDESKKVDELLAQFKSQLIGQRPNFKDIQHEIKNIEREDLQRTQKPKATAARAYNPGDARKDMLVKVTGEIKGLLWYPTTWFIIGTIDLTGEVVCVNEKHGNRCDAAKELCSNWIRIGADNEEDAIFIFNKFIETEKVEG